ncbi:ribonuclease H-like domain-containing protein [Tanacetum coccineum]
MVFTSEPNAPSYGAIKPTHTFVGRGDYDDGGGFGGVAAEWRFRYGGGGGTAGNGERERDMDVAEYHGVANVVAEIARLGNFLQELHSPFQSASLVYFDNISVVYLSSNPVQYQHTKHIEIAIYFVHDQVAAGHDWQGYTSPSLKLRSNKFIEIRLLTDMSAIPPRIEDALVFITPISKGNSVLRIISRIVLAAATYYLWNEINLRLFKKMVLFAEQIFQDICYIVRLKLVTFKFKKVSA